MLVICLRCYQSRVGNTFQYDLSVRLAPSFPFLCFACSTFILVWLEKLVPTRPGHDPMDYTPATPMPLDRDVTIDDVKSFFVSYMQHDRLGQTATAHKVWSDKH